MSKEKLSALVAKLDELASSLSTLPSCADDVSTGALIAAVIFFSGQCEEIADELREQLNSGETRCL